MVIVVILNVVMPSVVPRLFYFSTECRYAECHYTERRGASEFD